MYVVLYSLINIAVQAYLARKHAANVSLSVTGLIIDDNHNDHMLSMYNITISEKTA